MGIDNSRLMNEATVRSYIRDLADQFEEPEQVMEFLNSCDMAQTALVNLQFNEYRYNHILQTHYIRGSLTERECLKKIEVLYYEYSQAREEFLRATKKLQTITSTLDLVDVGKILMEMMNTK